MIDFLQKSKTNLGLSVGVGYEINYYVSRIEFEIIAANGLEDKIESKRGVYMHGNCYVIGLYTMINHHHIIELNYKINGSNRIAYEALSAEKYKSNNSLALSYIYKF